MPTLMPTTGELKAISCVTFWQEEQESLAKDSSLGVASLATKGRRSTTSILPAFRPPSRHKARNLDPFRLICHAEAFIEAVKRGFKAGSFEMRGILSAILA